MAKSSLDHIVLPHTDHSDQLERIDNLPREKLSFRINRVLPSIWNLHIMHSHGMIRSRFCMVIKLGERKFFTDGIGPRKPNFRYIFSYLTFLFTLFSLCPFSILVSCVILSGLVTHNLIERRFEYCYHTRKELPPTEQK